MIKNENEDKYLNFWSWYNLRFGLLIETKYLLKYNAFRKLFNHSY